MTVRLPHHPKAALQYVHKSKEVFKIVMIVLSSVRCCSRPTRPLVDMYRTKRRGMHLAYCQEKLLISVTAMLISCGGHQ